jgi:hypothetical protein
MRMKDCASGINSRPIHSSIPLCYQCVLEDDSFEVYLFFFNPKREGILTNCKYLSRIAEGMRVPVIQSVCV